MRKLCLLLPLIITGIVATAQTKKIAFKSHSGCNDHFHFITEGGLFDSPESNFGHAPQPLVKDAMLDSVIFVNDTLAIMVTSEYCNRRTNGGNTPKPKPVLWRAGRENAPNHPLFSRRHSLDSIKAILKQYYYFNNTVESVVFVGYDNEKKYKAFSMAPAEGGNSRTPGGEALLIVSVIIVLSAAGGWVAWKQTGTRVATVKG